jgi:hypothetical protein
LKAAEREWLAQPETLRKQQAAMTAKTRSFTAHLIPFLAVNAFLISHGWAL